MLKFLTNKSLFLISDEDSLTTEITQAGEYSFDVRTDIHELNEAITATLQGAPCVPAKFGGVKLPKLNINKFD